MSVYEELATALQPHGLIVRGGFPLTTADQELIAPNASGGSLVLIGNAGGAMWQAFAPHQAAGPDPLDTWTEKTISPIADAFAAQAVFPWSKPFRPFQQWAMRAEALASSPLGILIHPVHGLWHAYRAALVFDHPVDLPRYARQPSPCDSCLEQPCLAACPVNAFADQAYDVDACAGYLSEPNGQTTCRATGCKARAACPLGIPYSRQQIQFHMAAFYASRRAI